MSQVKFETVWRNIPVEVMSGWDIQMGYYHFTIFDLRPDAAEETLFSCLSEGVYPDDIQFWKDKVKELGITVPNGFWERAERREGNTIYRYSRGRWNR